eukprot:762000-Hanusia_phi.AAC.1
MKPPIFEHLEGNITPQPLPALTPPTHLSSVEEGPTGPGFPVARKRTQTSLELTLPASHTLRTWRTERPLWPSHSLGTHSTLSQHHLSSFPPSLSTIGPGLPGGPAGPLGPMGP